MNLEEAFYDMRDENAAAAKLQEACSSAGYRRESLYRQMDEFRNGYGKKLRRIVQRRAARIVRKNSRAWCVDVDVFPLHNHTTHDTLPLVTIRWADKGTDLKLTCVPSGPLALAQFLERFEHVIVATQLHSPQPTCL